MSRRAFRGRGRCGAPGCRRPASCEQCEACEECCLCDLGDEMTRRAGRDDVTVRLDQEPWQDPDSMEDDDSPFFWNR